MGFCSLNLIFYASNLMTVHFNSLSSLPSVSSPELPQRCLSSSFIFLLHLLPSLLLFSTLFLSISLNK